jgi:hypothetical protein
MPGERNTNSFQRLKDTVVAFFSRTDIDNARNGEEVTTIRDSAIAHEGIKFGLPVKDTAFGKLCLDLFKDLDPNGTRKAVRLKWGKAVSSFPELDSNTWKRLEIDVYVGFSKVEKPGVMGLEIRLLALDGVHVEQKVGPVNEQLYEALKALPNVVDIDIDNTGKRFNAPNFSHRITIKAGSQTNQDFYLNLTPIENGYLIIGGFSTSSDKSNIWEEKPTDLAEGILTVTNEVLKVFSAITTTP